MAQQQDLNRFVEAQEKSYKTAYSEIESGRKRSHWMWFVFPQLKGLGLSETARFYGIEDLNEARNFFKHPVLGPNLINISKTLLTLKDNNATNIFGSPDDMKLKSSMTLFSALPDTDPVFEKVLNKFYDGNKDEKTLKILGI